MKNYVKLFAEGFVKGAGEGTGEFFKKAFPVFLTIMLWTGAEWAGTEISSRDDTIVELQAKYDHCHDAAYGTDGETWRKAIFVTASQINLTKK